MQTSAGKIKALTLLSFILIKFIIQYQLIDTGYDLHRDEYLHLDQAHHLAWGFMSVPPVTSWISLIILALGNGIFWVKFFPALFGALTLAVVWKATEELKGDLFACVLAATAVLLSTLMRINILYQPNSFDILFWTLLYFTVIKYINSEERKWLYYTAIVFAFGFLNKYNIVFLLVGLLPAMLVTAHRKIFFKKDFYLALLVALVIVSPNLIWQIQNDFPVVHHMRELAEKQLDKVSRAGFLRSQILYFFGGIFILLAAFVSFFRYEPFRKFRMFFWAFWFTLSVFTALKAKGYYAIGLYPILLSFGAVYIETLTTTGWTRYLRPVALIIPVLLFIPVYRISFPNKSPQEIAQNGERYQRLGLLRWEDGKDHTLPQDFADMLGWKELVAKTDSAWDIVGKPDETLVLCDNYGEAGAINYYSKNKNIQAVSMNADYIDWFPFDRKIRNLIWVREAGDTTLLRMVSSQFATSVLFDDVKNPLARETGTTIYLLRDAPQPINDGLKHFIDQNR